MIGLILLCLFIVFSISKFMKHKGLFKQLSKKEWVQYIGGYLCALAVAILIIIGGSTLLDDAIQIDWINKGLKIILILIGLTLAGFMMKKTIPEKLKEFYS